MTVADHPERAHTLISAISDEHLRARARECLRDLDRVRAAHHHRNRQRAAVDEALAVLRPITEPHALLRRSVSLLRDATDLDVAVIARVKDGRLHVEATAVHAGATDALALPEAAALAPPAPEADIVRRPRTAILVRDPGRGTPRSQILEALGADACIVSPVTLRSRPIALIYGARVGGPAVSEFERETVAVFTEGVSLAFERATLRRRLQHERHELRKFLDWVDARSAQLADAGATLVLQEPAAGADRDGHHATHPQPHHMMERLLTRREAEVLQLLGDGMTNQAIADELVISTGTVKFHVNRLLAKLHVSNRAEAVARYYSLLGTRSVGDANGSS